ncbi:MULTISPECIES: carboxymuconolactone decarboxylase family protein [unclassified Modestobacter]|uniref:carboxymuconolactone decarboxylase family protein n=1 Tax=unclassified Modestobacter TaxID=2643866 RepID=UPI0022AAB9A8|nr:MULTISPECIES: carboxymuconolactone decarboxylase family protein [unclassified Modestobacter]MCZ2823687.1 carboxymuconolactone decarboxylase family protein [Modestobacter sp. VKM Ac-2981]MCZ2851932.1 carboxymuconolactone decarboxylase family protein [Modestobacter sp. VKM Ac-2982]
MTTDTARISLDPPRTLLTRAAEWWSRRTYGAVLDPGAAMAHHPRVLLSQVRFEKSVARWRRLDPTLKALAVMSSATTIGCAWCLDFGFWESSQRGVDPAKLGDVPRWRDSPVYSDLERRVMAYAEAMTVTPPQVTDEMVADLRRDLDDAQLVELTMMISVENSRSRTNAALGLTSQGFRDRCEVPGR